MEEVTPILRSLAVAVPPRELLSGEAARLPLGGPAPAGADTYRRLVERSRVETRRIAYPPDEILRLGGATQRAPLYERSALDLGERAAREAIAASGLDPRAIRLVVSASCTGYVLPSFDAHLVDRLGLDPGEVNTIIRQGDTKQTVLKVADELNSDLIVMGSRGMNRLQAILSNSASQYVFQLSTRPMLLVRDDLYIRHINRVMVTIDGTGVGDNALKLACELVRDIPGGTLTGVHVSRQEITPSRGGKSPAEEAVGKAIQRARAFGVELTTVQRSGDVGRMVCAAAEELKADLLVIASQDRRPVVARGLVDIDRLLGSSVSDYIRVHAPAPVLLVREPEGRS